MKLGTIVAITACLATTGGGGYAGFQFSQVQRTARINTCANSIKTDGGKRCTQAIQDALAAVQLASVKTEIQYRDRVRTVTMGAATERLSDAKKLAADIAALKNQDHTDACSAAPAMRAVRRQLCDATGGSDCSSAGSTPVPVQP